jgi:serine/threonine protein kinase
MSSHEKVIGCNGFAIFFNESDKVKYIDFSISEPFNLGRLIDEFGDPMEVYFVREQMGGSNDILVTIPFADHGIWFVFRHGYLDYSVNPKMIPESMSYWPVGSKAYFTPEYMSVMGVMKAKWQGFGDYQKALSGN